MTTNNSQAATIEWARKEIEHQYIGDAKAFAEDIGYDPTVVGRIMAGTYGADVANFCAAVERLRKKKELKQTEMVPTEVTMRRFEEFDYADGTNTLLIHHGPNRTGKTISAEHWCHRHRNAIYVLVPTQIKPWSFMVMLCEAAQIKTEGIPFQKLQRQLFEKLSRKRNLLYVDEAGYLLKTVPGGISMGPMGIIKDIIDICGCAVILTMQSSHFKEMTGGRNSSAYAQLIGRAGHIFGEPANPRKTEIRQLLQHFVEEPTADMLRLCIESANDPERMSAMLHDLKRASWNAMQENRTITAKDIRDAQKWRRSGTVWKSEE